MAGFQQVDILRELKFKGLANYQGNVSGLFLPNRKIFDCGFAGTSTLYGWSSTTGANGCTLATSAVDGGAMKMTMGGVAQDCGEFYHATQWSPAYNCGMMAKVKISQITETCVFIGFVDVYENTNDHIACEVDLAAARETTNTKDYCGMIFDTDATTDVWYCAADNNDTEGTPVAALGALAPTANTWFYVLVQTDTAGNVTCAYGTSINRLTKVGYLPTAIAYASTDLLTPYVGFIAHDTTAQVCTISRIVTWQDN